MPFVRKAKEFISNPEPEHANHPQYEIMKDTLKFLLNGHIGRGHGCSTDDIIEYLNQRDHDIHREGWQINILGYLRDHGIYIGSLRGRTGMFLIENEEDAQEVYQSIHRRMEKVQDRLNVLEGLIEEAGWSLP